MHSDLDFQVSDKLNATDYTETVKYSGNRVVNYEYSPSNSDFSNGITFDNIIPIGDVSTRLMSRDIKIRYTLTITSIQAAGARNHIFPHGVLYQDGALVVNSSLRAFPLQSISDSVIIGLNNCNRTWNSRQTLSPLLRLINISKLIQKSSTCPCRPDNQFSLLNDISVSLALLSINHPQSTNTRTLLGYSRNSLYPSSYTSVVGPPLTFTWVFDIEESLLFPGICSIDENAPFLPNIQNLNLSLNYSNYNLQSDILSCSPFLGGNTYNDTLFFTISKPKLVLSFIQADSKLIKIPRQYLTSFNQCDYFSTMIATDTDFSTITQFTVTSEIYTLSSTPKLLCIFFRQPLSSRNGLGNTGAARAYSFPQSDACLGLQSDSPISINYGTQYGLLSTSNSMELYKMSVENGSNQTYSDWSSGSGAWIFIDIAKNCGIDLQNGETFPGENKSTQLQVTLKLQTNNVVADLTSAAILINNTNCELVVIPIYAGQMTITPERVNFNTVLLNNTDVLKLVKQTTV